jgi:hypothetical protein
VDRDWLLTNVMLYWLTRTAGSVGRIYYERVHAAYPASPSRRRHRPRWRSSLPTNFIPLRHIAERTNTIVQWTEYDRGGHFAALEQPELLAGDIRCFFRGLRA